MSGTNLSDVESATRVNASSKKPGPERSENPFFPNQKTQKDISGAKALYGALREKGAARKWAVRGVSAVAVAVACALITSDWRIGATLGIAAMVGISMYQSRRESEIPRWRKPSAAQRKTEVQLKLMKQLGYRVLHARTVPGGNGQIDHFIVGRRGAFAIDSESWDKRLPLRNKLEQLYHGRFNKNQRIDEALEEAKRAEELISKELGREIKVRASLAIYGPGMPWDSHRLRGVDIISGTKVRKWLRTGRARLTEQEIEDIHKAAERVLPPRN
ncbi:nuclease-related domain-containing protein [Nocardiopsis flavescens]|uniref:Nuclease-related domain-containing protein n=1 Tax=Nocardiopsis flavescens TaxID=758803 RepID=A0A1M6IU25_9ACTN|nr:nuclease-related domain-containing protein [Nocardiopsis flavescens]SHJ37922.1 Nuclease-related domain-containing protein [Nocardiopsis flavescens]